MNIIDIPGNNRRKLVTAEVVLALGDKPQTSWMRVMLWLEPGDDPKHLHTSFATRLAVYPLHTFEYDRMILKLIDPTLPVYVQGRTCELEFRQVLKAEAGKQIVYQQQREVSVAVPSLNPEDYIKKRIDEI